MGSTLVGPASGACAPAEAEAGSVRGVPGQYVPTYGGAAERFALGVRGPAILAAIHKVETDFGRSPLPGVRSGENFAGAGGPMQFLGPTWAAYGVDGDGDGTKDRYDPDDAIFGAANYLSASGAPRDWYRAIFAYNHADWYVRDVLRWAKRFGDVGSVAEASCGPEAAAAELGRAVRLYEPREFRTLPRGLMAAGYAPQPIDARLYDNAVWILRTYELRVTAARESGHATHGDGTALDMVPAGDIASQAVWDRSAGRLAADLGWRRSCAASGSKPLCPLVPAIQFIGYDGYPSHGSPRTCDGGCPAHIHVSWASSSFGSGPLRPPARWVMAFPAPGERA
ncbi:MAG: lytic transglycosylase domain-containing protein [Acidobacteria bacterium]|nr:MAG: lytic transglycosylase domain-containing protein [Acidobacteriota bacterium]